MSLEAKVQELLDYKAITELRAKYFRTVDAKDWEGFRSTFTDDCTFDFGDGNLIEGADAFVAVVHDQAETAVTVHRACLPEITIDSPTEAHGLWQLNDYLEWPPNPETGERQGVMGYGHEADTYRKVDGEWKIASWKLHYIRFDPLLPQPLPERVSGGPELMREDEFVGSIGGE
jgi:hypothetical protein